MNRVIVLSNDERRYHELADEAAKEGRPVEDVVAAARPGMLG